MRTHTTLLSRRSQRCSKIPSFAMRAEMCERLLKWYASTPVLYPCILVCVCVCVLRW